jgi:hypothetical protein
MADRKTHKLYHIAHGCPETEMKCRRLQQPTHGRLGGSGWRGADLGLSCIQVITIDMISVAKNNTSGMVQTLALCQVGLCSFWTLRMRVAGSDPVLRAKHYLPPPLGIYANSSTYSKLISPKL